MIALPPPINPKIFLVAEARRRGHSLLTIGENMNVSHQAIEQFLSRHARFFGPITVRVKKRGVTQPAKCHSCGKIVWEQPSKARNRQFCSRKCSSFSAKKISDEMVRIAIDMRYQAHTWKDINKRFKLPVQTIQKNIWFFLSRNDMLTRKLVQAIWNPTCSEQRIYGKFNWLMNQSGLIPK